MLYAKLPYRSWLNHADPTCGYGRLSGKRGVQVGQDESAGSDAE